MRQRNSSTSSSKDSIAKDSITQTASQHLGGRVRTIAKASLGFVCTLVALDAAINLLFPYPTDPLNVSPSAMSLYFDYGRSIEGKVTRQLGNTDETSAPIARAGWLDSSLEGEAVKPAPGAKMLVAIYGMSFVQQTGDAMKKLDPEVTVRMFVGPSAPPNYSFAAYQVDRRRHQADVVVLGILASSVKGMDAMTGMTWGAEVPAAYTFPRYEIENGQLTATQPEVRSLSDLRAAQQNSPKWDAFVHQLQEHDRFFNSFLFEKNWLDSSAIIRLIRRAWAKSHQDSLSNQIHTADGFNPNWQQVPVLERLIEEFAASAKQDGRLPIVILYNDQGYDDHLYQLLRSTLEQNNIPFISTHDIAPATDRSNFVADGHFTEAMTEQIAERTLTLIQEKGEQARQ